MGATQNFITDFENSVLRPVKHSNFGRFAVLNFWNSEKVSTNAHMLKLRTQMKFVAQVAQ